MHQHSQRSQNRCHPGESASRQLINEDPSGYRRKDRAEDKPSAGHVCLDGEERAPHAHREQASELGGQEHVGDELNQAGEHAEALAQDGAYEVRRGSRLRRMTTEPAEHVDHRGKEKRGKHREPSELGGDFTARHRLAADRPPRHDGRVSHRTVGAAAEWLRLTAGTQLRD